MKGFNRAPVPYKNSTSVVARTSGDTLAWQLLVVSMSLLILNSDTVLLGEKQENMPEGI